MIWYKSITCGTFVINSGVAQWSAQEFHTLRVASSNLAPAPYNNARIQNEDSIRLGFTLGV